jgi:hypothetical protein
MKDSVSALVSTPACADEAIDQLKLAGFAAGDISFLYSDAQGSNSLFHVNSTKAPEGIVAGGGTGGLIGGMAGLLLGVGALTIPGLGPFIAAGPIMTALSGAALGATAGGLGGCFVGLGFPEYEAKLYAGNLTEGSMLIVVHCGNDPVKSSSARAVFESVEACGISSSIPGPSSFSASSYVSKGSV